MKLPPLPLLCSVLSFLLYSPTIFTGSIVWDDRAALSLNKDALGERPLSALLSHDFWGQDITLNTSHKSWRPLATLSLRLNHSLHGLRPAGYHLVNVLLHSLTCAAIASFSLLVLPPSAAHVSSLLFSVHSVHTEPVSCIVGRADLLAGFFLSLSLLLRLRSSPPPAPPAAPAAPPAAAPAAPSALSAYLGCRPLPFFLSLFLGVLSTLSKEVGVTTFGVLLSYEIILAVCSTSGPPHTPKSLLTSLATHFSSPAPLLRSLLYVLLPSLLILFHLSLHSGASLYRWSVLENSFALLPSASQRALSFAHTHFLYFFKLMLPFSLCYDYGAPCIPPVLSLLDYRNPFSLLLYASTVAFGVKAALDRNPARLWAGALLVVPFLPAANVFFPVGTVLGERLLYVPSMGFCLGVGALAGEALDRRGKVKKLCGFPPPGESPSRKKNKKNGGKSTPPVPAVPARFVGFLLLLATPLMLKTVHRCFEWRTEETLFESALSVCPTSLKVLNNLALVLLDKPTAPRAGELLDTAIDLHPDYPSALFNRGLVHYIMEEWELAVDKFDRTIALDFQQPKAHAYRAQTLLTIAFDKQQGGNWDEAETCVCITPASEREVVKLMRCLFAPERSSPPHPPPPLPLITPG
jgi:hypothetical protein